MNDSIRLQRIICGYPFRFIQQLIPDCQNGVVIKYHPQENYINRKNLPLSKYGDGSFCHFTINAPSSSGVYLWIANEEIIYIGETQDFAKRFNAGYGNISPRNCYIGGQNTNCKMNKVVMEYYEKHTPIELYFFETEQYKQVELELLSCYNTKYNTKDN
ncbi:GIY-YIG nuclease family protein [Candidatus Saccharibacteria bacterium]|nr:GIY-YIG nuclease family protein [Candidatus Saccharibacteria bacterium]